MRVLLLNMPWISLARPAIGVSILKSCLAREGIDCDVGYGNLLFASRIGRESYDLVGEHMNASLFVGDWLFAQYLFGTQLDLQAYAFTLQNYLAEDSANNKGNRYETILGLRHEIGPFLGACFDAFRIDDYDVVGFTTTFEQNLASLALAHHIKARYPNKVVVFGGGNCEGSMGLELHRSFPWIDYVCSGESEVSFPELVRAIAEGRSLTSIPGVIGRVAGETRSGGKPMPIRDMDQVPDPDYDDYFAAIQKTPFAGELKPGLLIESARGCWWGEKSHCTFCGLNGATMAFRAKSAHRVLDEIERQVQRYGIREFTAVDNILPYEYFKTLLPTLKQRRLGVSLFYEIKSNLKRQQVELLRDAGVMALQPGIESLSTPVLKLMRKGVTGIQNVKLLRLCREYGIEIAWNLLYGFPGENAEHYREMLQTVESIQHLKPPTVMAPIRLDRFSPNYNEAESLGLSDVRPFSMYSLLYPLPADRVANLAYFFDYSYKDGTRPATYTAELRRSVEAWQANKGGDLIAEIDGSDTLRIVDTRPGRLARAFPLSGLQRDIYFFCDEVRTRISIVEHAASCARSSSAAVVDPASFAASVDAFLAQMTDFQLMLQEDDQYLSLAIPRRVASVGTAETETVLGSTV